MKPFTILISNDDGFDAPGIQELRKAVAPMGRAVIVAPHRERSTAGHSLTLHKPLRLSEVSPDCFATSGTPADCIYIGTREVLRGNPDLILTGINRGANLGTDVHYSGTVAAAREGALMNIPSIAFSLVERGDGANMDYVMAARMAKKVAEKAVKLSFPNHTLLNVNIPNIPEEKIKGIVIARQGFRYYSNDVLKRLDPRGKEYFWIGGPYKGFEAGVESDCHAVEEGYVSVTPITIDCTHNEFYTTLKKSF